VCYRLLTFTSLKSLNNFNHLLLKYEKLKKGLPIIIGSRKPSKKREIKVIALLDCSWGKKGTGKPEKK